MCGPHENPGELEKPPDEYQKFTAQWKAFLYGGLKAPDHNTVPHSKQTTEPRTGVTQYFKPSNFRGVFTIVKERAVSNTLL